MSHCYFVMTWVLSMHISLDIYLVVKLPIICEFRITACGCTKLLQWCLTLCDLTECSPLGSSVRGILKSRILEWPLLGDLPNSATESESLKSPELAGYSCLENPMDGQRSLAYCSPWGRKESDTTEPLHFFATRTSWEAHKVCIFIKYCPYMYRQEQ